MATGFVEQTLSVGHHVWPSETGTSTGIFNSISVTTTSGTNIPDGASATLILWLQYPADTTWYGVCSISMGPHTGAGSSCSAPIEGALLAKATIDVVGAAVVIGADVTLT